MQVLIDKTGYKRFTRGFLKTIIAISLINLAACGSVKHMPQNVSAWAGKIARPESHQPAGCSAWQKIDIKNHSRYLLLQKDPKLLMNIDAHNLRGRNAGCWS